MFPLANGLEALGNQKPPQLDDQNANVGPAGIDILEEDLAEYAPSDDEREVEGSPEPEPPVPPPPEDPRPAKGWDPFKLPDGRPVPEGYTYDGTRLVRKKRGSARPLDTPSSAWVMMSQKDRAKDAERYRLKLEAEREAAYQELKKATPAMPVTHGHTECHREHYAHCALINWVKLRTPCTRLLQRFSSNPKSNEHQPPRPLLTRSGKSWSTKGVGLKSKLENTIRFLPRLKRRS